MLHVPAVSKELAAMLREARVRRGLTQQQLAEAIGVSRPAVGQWETGAKLPSTGHLMKLALHLNFRWEPIMRGELVEDERPMEERGLPLMAHSFLAKPLDLPPNYFARRAEANAKMEAHRLARTVPNVRLAPDAPVEALAAQVYLPLDVPVLGVSMGGDGHDFQFNGETVDYVRRPLGIAKAKRAYATYVVGVSMWPAFNEGAVLFVNPDKPPSIGDDVVIELHPLRDDGQPGPGYIKRLKKRTPTKIIVEQFNPPEDLEFEITDLKAMHRVVPWNELLGI